MKLNDSANRLLLKAMSQSDRFVVALDYVDAKGEQTRRVVSPIRFLKEGRFLALCLCREEPRQFHLDRCSNLSLQRSEDVLMPMAMPTPVSMPAAAAGPVAVAN